jgi:hypothetical protein
MILALGARGPEFDSRNAPFLDFLYIISDLHFFLFISRVTFFFALICNAPLPAPDARSNDDASSTLVYFGDRGNPQFRKYIMRSPRLIFYPGPKIIVIAEEELTK